jgi:hypothetical protein
MAIEVTLKLRLWFMMGWRGVYPVDARYMCVTCCFAEWAQWLSQVHREEPDTRVYIFSYGLGPSPDSGDDSFSWSAASLDPWSEGGVIRSTAAPGMRSDDEHCQVPGDVVNAEAGTVGNQR